MELDNYEKYKKIEVEFLATKNKTLPLCAAENRISPFARLPLSSEYQERYIMNGIISYDMNNNFIGSHHLYEIYKLIASQCSNLFGAKYADARTLSGMNCVTSLLMSLTQIGDKIMVSSSESGGHPSMEKVCKRLGLTIIDMPYDYENFDLDYEGIYTILASERISFFLFAPSDLINLPDYSKLRLPENTLFLYDASQTLGLIAGKQIENPLNIVKNCVLFGGTHKTLPGPANGLIMTNIEEIATVIDNSISPHYLRHTQMHQVVSLLFTLFEMEAFGEAYALEILEYSKQLGNALHIRGMNIPFVKGIPTFTHQVFIKTSEDKMNTIFNNAFKNNITLNKKQKKLFNGFGIRVGTQELARLNWSYNPIEQIADILCSMQFINDDINHLLVELKIPQKLRFTFKEEEV